MKKVSKITQKATSASKRILAKSESIRGFAKEIAESRDTPQLPDVGPGYNKWVQRNLPDHIELYKLKKIQDSFAYKPMISVIVCINNANSGFLIECLDSVMGQVYENWQLYIVGSGNKKINEIIEEYTNDNRVETNLLNEKHDTSEAIGEAVKTATGEYIAFCDPNDVLWPNALYEAVKVLNQDKTIDFLYTDEDKITEDRHNHLVPFFKPDWNPDLLHSVNYIKNFSVIKKSLYEKVSGEQDWDLFLRLAREAVKLHHIPKIAYSQRVSDSDITDRHVIEARKKAIENDILRAEGSDVLAELDSKHSEYWKVTYPLKDKPLVSIVIPTKNQYKIIKQCIESIYSQSTYDHFEIVLVDTGSDDQKVLSWYEDIQKQHDNITLVEWTEKPFSYARSCNEGVRIAKGEIIILLNNDTQIITPEWIELLAGDAQRGQIGAVGCLLLYPDESIQHAGVGVGLGGAAANLLQTMKLTQPMSRTQHIYANTRHNMTAVTAACMAIRKSVFEEVGGFDESFRNTYNDIDLCLKLVERGYRNLYTPYVRLMHYESISLGLPDDREKRDIAEFEEAKERFKTKWRKYIDHDPAFNPNLNKGNAFYDFM